MSNLFSSNCEAAAHARTHQEHARGSSELLGARQQQQLHPEKIAEALCPEADKRVQSTLASHCPTQLQYACSPVIWIVDLPLKLPAAELARKKRQWKAPI